MIVVLPFSTRDWGTLQALLAYLKDLGGDYSRHRALVVCAPNASEFQAGIVEAALEIFPRVDTLVTSRDIEGWPRGCNALFVATALEILTNPIFEGPWYFFEPDNTPLDPEWLNKIETEYNLSGKACLGALSPTRVIVDGQETTQGEHMMGSGVYPHNLPQVSNLFDTIRYTDLPWDTYLQHEVISQCHATSSIQHIWNVKNARREDGKIVCDAGSEVSQPVPVDESALVVHGFKDGSLIALLQRERNHNQPGRSAEEAYAQMDEMQQATGYEDRAEPRPPKRHIRRRPGFATA